MPARWTRPAKNDLHRIVRYIRRENPEAALRVAQAIFNSCENLSEMPYRGRKGKDAGTRELVLSGLPYVAVYRVHYDVVEILHIWHGAQYR